MEERGLSGGCAPRGVSIMSSDPRYTYPELRFEPEPSDSVIMLTPFRCPSRSHGPRVCSCGEECAEDARLCPDCGRDGVPAGGIRTFKEWDRGDS